MGICNGLAVFDVTEGKFVGANDETHIATLAGSALGDVTPMWQPSRVPTEAFAVHASDSSNRTRRLFAAGDEIRAVVRPVSVVGEVSQRICVYPSGTQNAQHCPGVALLDTLVSPVVSAIAPLVGVPPAKLVHDFPAPDSTPLRLGKIDAPGTYRLLVDHLDQNGAVLASGAGASIVVSCTQTCPIVGVHRQIASLQRAALALRILSPTIRMVCWAITMVGLATATMAAMGEFGPVGVAGMVVAGAAAAFVLPIAIDHFFGVKSESSVRGRLESLKESLENGKRLSAGDVVKSEAFDKLIGEVDQRLEKARTFEATVSRFILAGLTGNYCEFLADFTNQWADNLDFIAGRIRDIGEPVSAQALGMMAGPSRQPSSERAAMELGAFAEALSPLAPEPRPRSQPRYRRPPSSAARCC